MNGKPTRYTHESLDGMRSDGLLQFVMVPNWIFGPLSQTRFDWVRWDTRERPPRGRVSVRDAARRFPRGHW